MVDYSKWDQLDVSDDEDEGLGKPRVQRFDAPQTVTIGGKDGPIEVGPSGGAAADDAGEEADGDEPMEAADEDLAAAGPCADHREDVLQCVGTTRLDSWQWPTRRLCKHNAAAAGRISTSLPVSRGIGGTSA